MRMVLDGRCCRLSDYSRESFQNQTIVYIEEKSCVLVLNQTATLILDIITRNANAVESVSVDVIVEEIMKKCSLPLERFQEIRQHVFETLGSFYDNCLLVTED